MLTDHLEPADETKKKEAGASLQPKFGSLGRKPGLWPRTGPQPSSVTTERQCRVTVPIRQPTLRHSVRHHISTVTTAEIRWVGVISGSYSACSHINSRS